MNNFGINAFLQNKVTKLCLLNVYQILIAS